MWAWECLTTTNEKHLSFPQDNGPEQIHQTRGGYMEFFVLTTYMMAFIVLTTNIVLTTLSAYKGPSEVLFHNNRWTKNPSTQLAKSTLPFWSEESRVPEKKFHENAETSPGRQQESYPNQLSAVMVATAKGNHLVTRQTRQTPSKCLQNLASLRHFLCIVKTTEAGVRERQENERGCWPHTVLNERMKNSMLPLSCIKTLSRNGLD